MSSRKPTVPSWARAADILALALLGLALYIAVDGGFVARVGEVRLSIRSAWRPVLWAAIVIIARHWFARQPTLLENVRQWWSDLSAWVWSEARAAGPLPDDDQILGRSGSGVADSSSGTGRWLLWAAAVIVLFAALTAFMTYPQIRSMDNAVAIYEGDALFSTWRLAWVAHELPRDPFNLFNANIFYPEKGALAFSDAMIVPALMAAPLLWAGVPQILTYNIIFLSGFALSGAGMFLLVRSLTGSTLAALVSGFIFAFLPYRYMHYAHLELQISQWMPLCLWAFHRTMKNGHVRDGLLTGFFLALQCLSSWYYGIFLCTFMAPLGVALLIGESGTRWKDAVRALAAGAVLTAVLIIPMVIPYFAARKNVGERPEFEIRFYSAQPINYLAAHTQNVTFGRLTSRFAAQERELFMGIFVPLLALVGLWRPLSAARMAYLAGLLLAFDLSLGYNGAIYPFLHDYVLPYRGLRVPARMAMVVGLALAILAGYGAARLLKKAASPALRGVAFGVMMLLVWSEYRSIPLLKPVWTKPSPIYDALPTHTSNVLLELPLVQPDISIEPIFMYFSTFHWNKMVNGYSGFSPPSYQILHDDLEKFPDEVSLATLRKRGTTHVIVHGAFMREGEYLDLVSRMNSCVDLQFVTEMPWHRGTTRLYRLRYDMPQPITQGRAHPLTAVPATIPPRPTSKY